MRVKTSFLIGNIVLFTIFWVVTIRAMELTVEVTSTHYEIIDLPEGLQRIQMTDFGNLSVPGKPLLPAKVYMIALPPGAEVIDVNITGMNATELPGKHRITPAALMLPSDHRKDLVEQSIREWQENFDIIYSSDQAYPPQVGEYLGNGGLRKYSFIRIAFFPFSYQPKSGRLIFYSSAEVSINYHQPLSESPKTHKMKQALSDTKADELASKLFINHSEAQQWYLPESKEDGISQTYDYIIITTDALQSSVITLKSWKQSIGFSPNVITTSWINSSYSGIDLPEKIRNFLKDKLYEWGIEYVLLAGDLNDVPMRNCYPESNNSSEKTPTDYYYADLTGEWNSDHDNYYGEYGQDNVDFIPEVYVGRIPWSDPTIVNNICQKIITFEGDMGSWKNNALLLGAISNYDFEDYKDYSKTDGAELMREMISNLLGGWNYTTMYEKAGLDPSSYNCNYPLTRTNVISNWSSHSYGIVNWKAHGSRYEAWRKYWDWDDGDGVPETESPDEMKWEYFISTSDVSALDDTYPSILFACSCENGWPESNNLAKMLLKQGTVSTIAGTRVSWYSVGWKNKDDGGNASIDYYFFHYLIKDNQKVGDALFNSKLYYFNNFFWWGWQSQQNMFTFCLYGDPALIRSGTISENITVTSPNGGENWQVGSNQTITWISTGTSGNVNIELSRDAGSTWENLFYNTPDDQSQFWTVTGPPSTNCQIRITDMDGTPLDQSDQPFTIVGEAEWTVPITISGGSLNYVRTFGGDPTATDGYDDGLDSQTAPPGMVYYTYFQILQFPNFLDTDIRSWVPPYDTDIDWTLKIVNAAGMTSTLSWNPADIPTQGSFTLVTPVATVDMQNNSYAQVSDDATLIIQYRSSAYVTYNFPQQGWYLISLPVYPENSDLNTLFSTAMAAFAYNSSTNSYYSVTSLEPKKGYWLSIPGPTSSTISGAPLNSYTENYNTGWHLIGSVLGTTNFTDPNDNPDGSIMSAWGWNTAAEQYFAVYPPGSGILNEQEGYWLAVAQPCDLTIGSEAMLNKAVSNDVDMKAFSARFGSHPPVPPFVNDISLAHSLQSENVTLRNTPNPFNLETVIEYSVQKVGITKVYIYNSLGQRIRTLLDAQQQTGVHQVVWDGRNDNGNQVNSGLYFCKIIKPTSVETRKMLLLK